MQGELEAHVTQPEEESRGWQERNSQLGEL